MAKKAITEDIGSENKMIGRKIKIRRIELDISQSKLGSALGISFQQVQKYEKGTNRFPIDKFLDLCGVLDCDIEYFFPRKKKQARLKAAEKSIGGFDFSEIEDPDIAVIAKILTKKDPAVRDQAMRAVRAVLNSFADKKEEQKN